MLEIALWALGFLLLVGVTVYAAGAGKDDQNAADRILKRRYLKSINHSDDVVLDGENTVEHR